VEVSNWTSAAHDCIGFQFRGRQTHDVHDCTIFADLPISIEVNPNNNISCDHYHLYNIYLNATNNPCVQIATGVYLSNTTFDGYQAWTGGTHGLFWNDTTGTGPVSNNLTLKNIRLEQTSDVTAYSFSISHNLSLQNLIIENCYLGDRRGFFFRKVKFLHLKDNIYTDPTREALNVDNTCDILRSTNNFWQVGATSSITGLTRVFQSGSFPNANIASDFCYVNTASYNAAPFANLGTITGNNAAAGDVGEYFTPATLAQGSALSLTSPNALNVTNFTLTAGDWDVWGVIDYLAGGATTFTIMKSGISTTSATIGAQDTFTNLAMAGTLAAASDMAQTTPTVRISIATATTVYLVAQATFAISTLKVYGSIFARRVR
jgi:hypothetical protein